MIDKKYLIIVPILLLISITIFVLKNKSELKFYLEDKYYEKSGFVDIDDTKLNELIDSKESFALFVYQPACVTSSNFEKVLNEFLDENPIQIYKIAFSNIKDTSLSKKIKYYPSFAIFNEGKMIDYLDADSDDDLKYYETKDGFNKWFTNYVLLKNMPNVNRIVENNKDETNDKSGLEKINLENVVYDQNKVNIYLFWGSTCPVCKNEFAFFDEIKEEYGNYYNLYTFEVWGNEENNQIMHRFADALNDEIKGVPYTVVGDTSFSGFGENTKNKILEAIKTKYKNSKDIYFDKIKKN